MPLLPLHVRGTMTALRASSSHLSPAIGLALAAGGSHLLGRLFELEPAVPIADGAIVTGPGGVPRRWQGSAACALTRELFHRAHPEEPLRPTANKSLPAAHLSASLCAHVLGLASHGASGSAAHEALRRATCSETGLPLPALARETGVTIARFERLVELVLAADADGDGPLQHTGTALVLRHLWLRSGAAGKRELWEYLRTLHAFEYAGLTADAAEAAGGGAGAEQAWVEARFAPSDLSEPAVLEAATALYGRDPQQRPASAAFEVLAASLAMGGARAAPLLQGRYALPGQPPVADCAELVARELLNALLWCPQRQIFDASRLPPSSSESLRAFYAPGGAASTSGARAPAAQLADEPEQWHAPPPQYSAASEEWFQLISELREVRYLIRRADGVCYEMSPIVDNVICALGVLMGAKLASPVALQRLWAERQARSPRTAPHRAFPAARPAEQAHAPSTRASAPLRSPSDRSSCGPTRGETGCT